jgi:hypothetical protein
MDMENESDDASWASEPNSHVIDKGFIARGGFGQVHKVGTPDSFRR